jgi:hypothetical protein
MASVLRVGVGQAVPLQVLNWRSIQAILSLAMGLGPASGSALGSAWGTLSHPTSIEVVRSRTATGFRSAMA